MKIPTSPQEPQPDIVRTPKEYVAPVVDTRVENYNTLSTFASGSKWACDFYLLVMTDDTAPQGYARDQLPIYGQYRRIRGFELLVTSPITPQQSDDVERGFQVTGTAAVYSAITPNEGSLFIADIGDGRNGLFSVTRTSRSAPFTESMTTIDFRQIQMLDQATELHLESRVVETLYFDRELMRNGLAPLIKQRDVDVNRRLIKAYRRLTNLYVHEFLDNQYKTFILPGQMRATYDPYMTNFVLRVLDKNVCMQLGDVIMPSAGHNPYARSKTVLDAVMELDDDLLYSVANKVGVASIYDWRIHPYFTSIAYTGIKEIVAVFNSGYMRDLEGVALTKLGDLVDAGTKKGDHLTIIPDVESGSTEPKVNVSNMFHPITKDEYYIFSEAFYKDSTGQSELESIVRARLAHEGFDTARLADIADQADKMDNLERFYLIPIIIAMIKVVPGVL